MYITILSLQLMLLLSKNAWFAAKINQDHLDLSIKKKDWKFQSNAKYFEQQWHCKKVLLKKRQWISTGTDWLYWTWRNNCEKILLPWTLQKRLRKINETVIADAECPEI